MISKILHSFLYLILDDFLHIVDDFFPNPRWFFQNPKDDFLHILDVFLFFWDDYPDGFSLS